MIFREVVYSCYGNLDSSNPGYSGKSTLFVGIFNHPFLQSPLHEAPFFFVVTYESRVVETVVYMKPWL